VFDALLLKVIPPCVHPVALGEYVTFTGTLCPAARVNGKVNPGARNAAPLVFIAETVTLVFPAFVNTTTAVSLLPTATLPKNSEEGEQLSCWAFARAHSGSMAAHSATAINKKRLGRCWVRDWGSLMSSVSSLSRFLSRSRWDIVERATGQSARV